MDFYSPALHIRVGANSNDIHIICVCDVIRTLSEASVAKRFHKAKSKENSVNGTQG